MSSPIEDRYITVESDRLKHIRAQLQQVEGSQEELQSDISNTNLVGMAGLGAGLVTAFIPTLVGYLTGKGFKAAGEAAGTTHTDALEMIGNIVGAFAGDSDARALIVEKLLGEKPIETLEEVSQLLPPEKAQQVQQIIKQATESGVPVAQQEIAVKQQVINLLSGKSEEEGWESGYLHGTPTGEITAEQEGLTHVTKDPNVAERYAHRKQPIPGQEEAPNPTVHNLEVKPGKVLDLRTDEGKAAYEEARQAYNKTVPEDKQLPPVEDILRKSGLPDYGHIKEIHAAMPEYDSIVTDEPGKGESLSVFDDKRIRDPGSKAEVAITHPERIIREPKPVETKPTEIKPVETKPAEAKVIKQTIKTSKTPSQIAKEEIETQATQSQLAGHAEQARQRAQRIAQSVTGAKGIKEAGQKLSILQKTWERTNNIYNAEVHMLLANPRVPVQKLATDIINLPVQATFRSIGVASEHHSLTAGAKSMLGALYAYRQTFKDAIYLAGKTFKSGEPEFLKSLGINDKTATYAAETAWDDSAHASMYRWISASKYAYGYGSKLIISADQFAKALAYSGELRMSAYNDGLKEAEQRNLVGAAKMHFADIWAEKLYADAPNWLHERALENSFKNTFTEHGQIVKQLNNLRHIPGIRVAIPFFRTPINLLKQGLQMTPFAPIPGTGFWNNIASGGLDQSTAIAKWMVGNAAFYEIAQQTMNGNITGDGPQGKGRDTWPGRNHPRSVRIGGRWHSYEHLGPFATVLSLAADATEMYHAAKDPDSGTRMMDATGQVFAEQVTHAPFLQEVYNMNHVVDSWKTGQTGRVADEFASRTASSFIPAPVRMLAGAEDPYIKRANTFKDMFAENIPGWSKTVPPKLNVYGYVTPYLWAGDIQGNSTTDLFLHQMNPFPSVADKPTDPVDYERYRLGYEPKGIPNVYWSSRDLSIPSVPLSDQQQYEWAVATGHEVKLGGLNLHDRWAQVIDSDLYKNSTPVMKRQLLDNWYHAYYEMGKQAMINRPVTDDKGNVSYPNRSLINQSVQQQIQEKIPGFEPVVQP